MATSSRRSGLLQCALMACAVATATASEAAVEISIDEHYAEWQKIVAASAEEEQGTFIPPNASEWYTVYIGDVSVGYMHTTVDMTTDDLRTMEVMDVQVSRGQDTSRMAFETVFVENPLDEKDPFELGDYALNGGVSSMAYDQRFANNEVRMNATFKGTSVTLNSFNGEKAHSSDVELSGERWLGRMRARMEFSEQCRKGERDITVQTMRPELGPRVVNLSSYFVRIEDVWDGEAMVPASIWNVKISDVPVNMTEAYPVKGPLRCYRMLQMGLDMPFGFLLASLSSKEAALKAAEDDPDRKLPELVYTMFVPLSRAIPEVNDASFLKISVQVKGDKGPALLELPSAGYQRVEKQEDNADRLTVTIDLQKPAPATEADLVDGEYRNPSAMVDNSDEVVVALAHTIDGVLTQRGHKLPADGEPLPAKLQEEMAYFLRDVVHYHISEKHLGTAYASASETARTKSGDCTEHAVLLAAVLKVRGIPARVCHGLVYVEQGGSAIDGSAAVNADGSVEPAEAGGQFGWHMWSQALINGNWIDLDATLHVAYSVGHVLVGTSSMSDKEAHNNHMQMAALIGNLEIVLIDVGHKWKSQKLRSRLSGRSV